jgi:hypothetical protein
MLWFKHYSDATSSVKLSCLLSEHGAEGYGFYWLFLELVSSKFDGSFGQIIIHSDEVLKKFRLNNCRKMVSFIKVLNDLSLIDVQTEGKLFKINPRILVKLKQKNFKLGHPEGKTEAPRVPLDLEENKNKKREKKGKALAPAFVNLEFQNYVAEHLTFLDQDELNYFKTGSKKALDYILQRFELNDIQRYFNQLVEYNLNNPKKAKKDFPMTLRNWMDKGKQEGKLNYKEDYINNGFKNVFIEAIERND